MFSDEAYDLRVEVDPGEYDLSATERAKMDEGLRTLRNLVRSFPVAELKIEIESQSQGLVRVGASLRLPSRTLFAAGEAWLMYAAWETAIRRLVQKVTAFKERLSNKPAYSKQAQGTLHQIVPTMEPDAEVLSKAIADLDYVAFRDAMAVYDEPLERRVGRWVERYPQAEERLGAGLAISEIMEEVYLNAFEQFADRPPVPLGEWLVDLIDPAIKMLLSNPATEKENLSFIASARQAAADRLWD